MGFIRVVVLIIFALVGFGSGICGLFGLGISVIDTVNGHGGGGVAFVIVISLVGLAVAGFCVWIIRILMRKPRPVTDAAPPPPPAPPTGAA